MNKTWRLSILVALGSILGCAGGDALEQAEGVERDELRPRLTVLTQNVEQGLTGMYSEGDRVVLFETIREVVTEPSEHHEVFDIHGVPLEISSRFTDEEGEPIFVVFAGNKSTQVWAGAMGATKEGAGMTDAKAERRQPLFELVIRAGKALEQHTIDPVMAPEKRALTRLAARTPSAAERVREQEQEQVPGNERSYSCATKYRQDFQVRGGGSCNFHQCGYHKRWYYTSSCTWQFLGAVDYPNHGSEACAACPLVKQITGPYRSTDNTWLYRCDYPTRLTGYCVLGLNCHNCRTDTFVEKQDSIYRSDCRSACGIATSRDISTIGSGCSL